MRFHKISTTIGGDLSCIEKIITFCLFFKHLIVTQVKHREIGFFASLKTSQFLLTPKVLLYAQRSCVSLCGLDKLYENITQFYFSSIVCGSLVDLLRQISIALTFYACLILIVPLENVKMYAHFIFYACQ